MTDYIKRKDLLDLYDLGGLEVENAKVPLNVVIQNIKDMPSADVVERKKGNWISYDNGLINLCPFCKMVSAWSNFCPNCGADMREL